MESFNNLKEILEYAASKFADRPAHWIRKEPDGEREPVTYKEFKHMVDSLGTALIDMGLTDDKIGVVGDNSMEWKATYLGTVNSGNCIVPLDKMLPDQELQRLIQRAKIKAIVFSDITQSGKNLKEALINMSPETNTIEHYISTTGADPEHDILSFQDVIAKGEILLENGDRRFLDKEIDSDKMSMIKFTSGTTAVSKGVMGSHRNCSSGGMAMQDRIQLNSDDVILSILPVHHIIGTIGDFVLPMISGSSVAYNEGLQNLAKDMQEVKPSVMFVTPAIPEAIHKQIWFSLKRAGKADQLKQFLAEHKLTREQAKEQFKDIYQGVLGGRLRFFGNAGAAISPEIKKGWENFGIPIFTAWGLTETLSGISCEGFDCMRNGSSGPMLPGIEAKILNPNEDGAGEIAVKGLPVMLGYYEDEQATKTAFTEDGFLRTGDFAKMDKDNFIYILGRLKNIIKTNSGELVFPEELEEVLNSYPHIKESLVYAKEVKGSSDSMVAASIFPDREAIQADFDNITEADIARIIQEDIDKFNEGMPPSKVIWDVDIRDKEFAKTSSRKIKRYGQIPTTPEIVEPTVPVQSKPALDDEER